MLPQRQEELFGSAVVGMTLQNISRAVTGVEMLRSVTLKEIHNLSLPEGLVRWNKCHMPREQHTGRMAGILQV